MKLGDKAEMTVCVEGRDLSNRAEIANKIDIALIHGGVRIHKGWYKVTIEKVEAEEFELTTRVSR